jgi:hypothetical protein
MVLSCVDVIRLTSFRTLRLTNVKPPETRLTMPSTGAQARNPMTTKLNQLNPQRRVNKRPERAERTGLSFVRTMMHRWICWIDPSPGKSQVSDRSQVHFDPLAYTYVFLIQVKTLLRTSDDDLDKMPLISRRTRTLVE